MTARSLRWLQRPSPSSHCGTTLSPVQRLVLAAAGIGTLAGWVGFMLWAPALEWTERPAHSDAIAATTWRVQAISLPMVLCALLVLAYLGLLWVIRRSRADLPASVVVGVFVCSGLCAVLTYPAFAQDVY